MGFLKFLKREKKKDEFEELDLPPAPPPLEGAETEFSSFEEKLPEIPELPEFGEKISAPEETPKFGFPEEEKMPDLGKESIEFPSFPEIEETEMPAPPISPQISPIRAPTTPKPVTPISQPTPEPEETHEEADVEAQEIYPKFGRRLFAHEKRIPRERPTAKTVYVRIDKFKATLGSINMVRSDLRKSEEALSKLENVKLAKDKSFDKLKSSLDDLQRKLIFFDKTLFKGDRNESF